MTIDGQRRRLIQQGFLFLLLAFVLGLAITALPHPTRWLSAHLSALMTGLMLAVFGFAWRDLRLTDGQRRLTFWSGLMAAYSGVVANIFGAIVDFPGPASNPGVTPPMPQAAVFYTLLAIIVPSLFITVGIALYGMRGTD
jgi:membrane associated rhomboid family serine protease